MEIARYWRLNNQRYTLTGTLCACCGKPSFSQRPLCDSCSGAAVANRSQHIAQHSAVTALEPAGDK